MNMKHSNLLLRMVVLVAAVICAIGADAAEAYACYTPSNTTLTFYYDNQRSSRPGTTYNANHIDKAYAHIDGGPSNPGYFTEKNAAMRGDVDGDGGVDISDLTTLINYLLTGNATGVNLSAADCDNSGNVNISDVTTLNNYLLRGNW